MNTKEGQNSIQTKLLWLSVGVLAICIITLTILISYVVNIQSIKYYSKIADDEMKIVSNIINNIYSKNDKENLDISQKFASLEEEEIRELIEDIGIGKSGFFILVNKNGRIIANSNNRDSINKNIREVYNKRFESILKKDLEKFYWYINGEKYIVSFEQIEGCDLIIVAFISFKELRKFSCMINWILSISMVLIVMMMILFVNKIKKITNPIKELAEYLSLISKGDFSGVINPDYLERNDEIGIITKGIEEMKKSLADMVYEINYELSIFKKITDEDRFGYIVIYDENNDVIYANDNAKNIYNIKNKNEFYKIKERQLDLGNKIGVDKVNEIKEGINTYGYWNGIIDYIDGKRTLDCKVQNINNKFNQTNMVIIFTEITERIKEEKELIEFEKMKSQEAIRNNFFANISHELRTPINIFYSTLQLLDKYSDKRSKEFGDIYLKYKQGLKTNCQRMLRLINNIVDITKIDVGFTETRFENEDIVRVVEEVTMSVVNYAKHKNLNIVFDTEFEEIIIKFDIDMIERIMLNLLSNAIKFTKEYGHIWVCINADEEWIYITVKDDGIGIPKEMQETIFERFIQSDSSFTRLNEGSGIGLAIVESLVKLCQGKIELYSDGKKGSEFKISLPNKKLIVDDIKDRFYEIDIQNTELELSDIYELQ